MPDVSPTTLLGRVHEHPGPRALVITHSPYRGSGPPCQAPVVQVQEQLLELEPMPELALAG